MPRTRIKICGITRPQDALVAVAQGADALGLVFYAPSPRAVTLEQAMEIADAVPPFVTLVSLFVDEAPAMITQVVESLPIGAIQFHGKETAAFCQQFKRPWFKAVRMKDGVDAATASAGWQGARGVLLDAWQDGVPGGTGHTFDWSRITGDLSLPLVLAGGLNAGNVGAAIGEVRPWAVDVSGGVESAPGIKDAGKIEQFVAAVRRADQQ
ncbi:phosphoribosylanthranilate isomerase [Pseudohalioglobus sediminis]|uniref:phosphoribosylanthranilate isomerase n=1 Tax=Pseudohalioglobus sediminis TaxID=2606449 RepID=UPI001CB6D562|nr:phosphoribosylanthranilate isomerase [Pseudohalioglobus sediminis]